MSNQLKMDAKKIHNLLKRLVRIYQFRDRDRIPNCCRGLTINQYYVIETIINNGSIGIIDLTKKLYIDKGNVSRIVDQLVQKGYIVKKTSQKDGRAIDLEVTPQSIAAYQEINDLEIIGMENLLKHLNSNTRAESINLISRIVVDAEKEFK